MELKGKSVLIVGKGVSGRGAYEALKRRINGAPFAHPYFFNDDALSDFALDPPDLVVVSPGIASHPAIDAAEEAGIEIISELELGFLLNRSPIIAVTGTNGKTTVTSLIGKMLLSRYSTLISGNIGSSFARDSLIPHEIAVLEVSSFQLERCKKFKPDIAVITNLSPDHLDRHKTMENYAQTKKRIAANQTENDFLILPQSLDGLFDGVKSKKIISDVDMTIKKGRLYFKDKPLLRTKDIKLLGEHNLFNVMQSACAAVLAGIKSRDIASAVREFVPEKHRITLVKEKFGKRWYDDSKGTNIDACLAACRAVSGDTSLILGGSDKGYDYDPLFNNLPLSIKNIYITGEVVHKLKLAADKSGRNVTKVLSIKEAVFLCAGDGSANVLLSPAAASFDCFRDYKHRGEEFLSYINSL